MQNPKNEKAEFGTLDIRGVASYLHIGMNAAYDLAKKPGFPAVRITERRIIVPVQALDKWLAEQTGKAVAE